MVTFFLDMMKLLLAVRRGLKQDVEFRILLFLLLSLLTGATLFYYRVEGWSLIDSLYFSVMTMVTIGYGDFVPTTTWSKLFTILFAIMSIGLFVTVITKIVKLMLEYKKVHESKLKKFVIIHPKSKE